MWYTLLALSLGFPLEAQSFSSMGVQSNVDAVAVTAAGTGCTTANGVSTTCGSGSGLELNVVVSGGAILSVTPSEITESRYLPGDTVSIVQGGCTADTLTVKALQDLDVHSALVTGHVSQDGWVTLEFGFTSGGPYRYQTTTYHTAQGGAKGTSTTSLTMGTGSQALTVTGNAALFAVGNVVTIWNNCERLRAGHHYGMVGGSRTLNFTSVVGSGSFSPWTVNAAGTGEYGPNSGTGMVHISIGVVAAATTVYGWQ